MSKPEIRMQEILKILKKKRLNSFSLANELNVNQRTVRRDLEKLKNNGRIVRKGHTYEVIPEGKVYPHTEGNICLELSPDDIEMLSTIYSVSTETDLNAGLSPIVDILEQMNSAEKKKHTISENAQKRIEIFKVIVTAIQTKGFLNLVYKNANGRESARLIKPYRFFMYGDLLYLCAWSGKKEELITQGTPTSQDSSDKNKQDNSLRTFVLRRIQKVSKPSKRRTEYFDADRSETEIQDYIDGLYNAYPIKRNQKVTLTVKPYLESYLTLHPIHPKQIMVKAKNQESLYVSFSGDINKPLIAAILRLGSDAVVEGPKDLRKRIKAELAETLKQYN